MIAIIPESGFKPGLWGIIGYDTVNNRVKAWNHHSDQWFDMPVETPMKVVHIRGAREGGDGKWAKYKLKDGSKGPEW